MKNNFRNLTFFLLSLLFYLCQDCSYNPGWISQASGTDDYLPGVWFIDSFKGFAVSDRGFILQTNDGGDTWTGSQVLFPRSDKGLRGVCFCDSMKGWAVGTNGIIIHTLDGGATWINQASGTFEQLNTVFCIDSTQVWIVGFNGVILHTADGGNTWTRQISGVSTNIFDIVLIDSKIGFAVGGHCKDCVDKPGYGGYILHTVNGGVEWNILKLDSAILGFYGIYFTGADTGTVVGAGGTILRTTDGGTSWTSQQSGTANNLMDVFFIDNGTGTVVGGNLYDQYLGGIILRTTDGGNTWIIQDIPTQQALRNVFFINGNTGTTVGRNGTILHTTTGGEPW